MADADTRYKRLAFLGFSSGGNLLPDPAVAGVDNADRFGFLELYGSILGATQSLTQGTSLVTEEEFYTHVIANSLVLFTVAVMAPSRLY